MRKVLARGRRWLGNVGIDLRPLTDPASGSYAGFLLQRTRGPSNALRGTVVEVAGGGKTARMFLDDERDLIQKHLLTGSFYEVEELELIAANFAGGCFVDVGANIGNHSVYAGAVLGARRIVAFEPNPRAARLLEINLALNGLEAISTTRHVGLSNDEGVAKLAQLDNNLGSARVSDAGSGSPIELARGDTLLAGIEDIGFIKMDVEGHEAMALEGLRETLTRCRPPLLVEVEDDQRDRVFELLESIGYAVAQKYARYGGRENILFRSRTGAT